MAAMDPLITYHYQAIKSNHSGLTRCTIKFNTGLFNSPEISHVSQAYKIIVSHYNVHFAEECVSQSVLVSVPRSFIKVEALSCSCPSFPGIQQLLACFIKGNFFSAPRIHFLPPHSLCYGSPAPVCDSLFYKLNNLS